MSEIRLTKARTFELDPKKKYLIILKPGAEKLTEGLIHGLQELGIHDTLVGVMASKDYKIIEISTKKAKKEKK